MEGSLITGVMDGSVNQLHLQSGTLVSGTPDDASDDYQLITWLLDDNADGVWGLVPDDHETSGGDNDPYTDRVYVHGTNR